MSVKRDNEVDAEAVALAEKKAAKKAKKAAAAASAEAEAAEAEAAEAAEAEAKAARKAAKKAKKAAAAAAAEAEAEEEEEAPVKAKKAKKAAAAEAEEEEAAPKKVEKAAAEEAPAPKPKAAEPEKAAAAEEDEEFKDNTYKCRDCSEDWVDTADDQQWRWNQGFAEVPGRCKDCRWAKKVRMEGGDPTAKGKGKKGKSGGDENTVFCRGLPFSATEEALNKDFGECGEIVSLRMPLNDEGSCRGIAFIKYADKEGMDKAMAFNETDYGGRTIYCSDAAIKPEGKGKDGKGKDGKGKGKDGKDSKGKGKGKGKKGKATSEAFAKNTGAMVESTGTKVAFADSDDE